MHITYIMHILHIGVLHLHSHPVLPLDLPHKHHPHRLAPQLFGLHTALPVLHRVGHQLLLLCVGLLPGYCLEYLQSDLHAPFLCHQGQV